MDTETGDGDPGRGSTSAGDTSTLTISLLGGAGVAAQGPELQLSCDGSQPVVLRDTGTPVAVVLKMELSIPWNSK